MALLLKARPTLQLSASRVGAVLSTIQDFLPSPAAPPPLRTLALALSLSLFVAKRRRSEPHLHVRLVRIPLRRLERPARVRVKSGDGLRRLERLARVRVKSGDGLHWLAHRDLLRPSSRRPGPL